MRSIINVVEASPSRARSEREKAGRKGDDLALVPSCRSQSLEWLGSSPMNLHHTISLNLF